MPLKPSALVPQATGLDWIYIKSYLSLWLGVPDEVLHIFAGLAILVGAALVLRRAPWDWRPWLVVVVAESANELYDVFQTSYRSGKGNWPSAWHDFWMTLFWPTVVLLLFRWLGARAR